MFIYVMLLYMLLAFIKSKVFKETHVAEPISHRTTGNLYPGSIE